MKQRLGIANALLGPRDLLVLDEPSNGLDPQGTREVRNLIRSLAAEGTTVFVSSHLLAEIEQTCTHVAVMRTGRLVAQGRLDELAAQGTARARIETPDAGDAMRVLTRLGLTVDLPTADSPTIVTAEVTVVGLAPEAINAALVTEGVRVRGFSVAGVSLEERFVALTGEGFDVAE
jgi:ABC-type multidrug transport system ATPase subunit